MLLELSIDSEQQFDLGIRGRCGRLRHRLHHSRFGAPWTGRVDHSGMRPFSLPPITLMLVKGPLLVQSVMCPIVGRLSDVIDRKYLASFQLSVAFIGSIVSAKANSMNTLIGGGILIGVGLSSLGIVVAIPAEVLPLKFRAIANGANFLGGAFGGL